MNCSSCFFGRQPAQPFAQGCYRYPTPKQTTSSHWCGEYAPIKANPNFEKPILGLKPKSK